MADTRFHPIQYRYLLYLIALLPALILRDFTPHNELKYVSIVDEALRNNTWFTFYNYGEAYADKPPLYFWLMMISRLISGDYYMWIFGLFSVVPAMGIMVVMDRWCRLDKVKHNAIISNLMLGTTIMFIGTTVVLRMDMMMTFFIVLSLYTFFKLYKGVGKPRDRWLLPVWIFLAIFSKGPMGFIIPLLSITVFLLIRHKIRDFGKYMGLRQWGILLGLCALWFGAVYIEGGWEYLNNILFKQTVGRGVDSFHHKEHLFYYFPRMLWSFAPWSLLYLVTIFTGVRRHLMTTESEKFFFTIVWVNIIMLSLVSSKIDIYMLPIYPFVVYLASAMLSRGGSNLVIRICVAIPAFVFALVWPASFFVTRYIPYPYESIFMLRLGLFFLSAGGVLALYLLYRKKVGKAISFAAMGMLVMIFFGSFDIPQFNRLIGFRQIAAEAQQDAEENGTNVYYYYKFKSARGLDVFLGTRLLEVDSVQGLDSLDNAEGKSVVFFYSKQVRRSDDVKAWLENRMEAGRAGDYWWLVVGQDPEPVPPAN